MDRSRKTVRKLIQVPKTQSFYIYFLLEAYEGLCMYSTLPESDPYWCDLELIVPFSQLQDLEELLDSLGEVGIKNCIPVSPCTPLMN